MSGLGRGSRVVVLAALICGAATAPAQSATLRGTVVAPPAVHGTSAVVPVVATSGRTVKVVVPRGAIRSRAGRIAAADLRFGDRVTASGARGAASRPHARALRVTRRGTTASFGRIAKRRAATVTKVKAAIDTIAALPQQTSQITGAQGALPADVRDRLQAVRTDVNLAIADLRDQAVALEGAATGAAGTARGSDAYLATLRGQAGDARKVADAMDVAVGRLDEAINDVGGESAPPAVPISGVGSVSEILHDVLDLLRGLG